MTSEIESLVSLPLAKMGYSLVLSDFDLVDGKKYIFLIEREDGSGVNIDDCQKVFKFLRNFLISENKLDDDTRIEVSSPGLDRPLTKIADFKRFQGKEIKLTLKFAVDDQKKFTGVIKKIDDNGALLIELMNEKREVELDFENIQKANLVPKYNF